MIEGFAKSLNDLLESRYGNQISEDVRARLAAELNSIQALASEQRDVYLTIMGAVQLCEHPINSPTPYQPSFIASLLGLVKVDPVPLVPLTLTQPFQAIDVEVCSCSEAFILHSLKSRYGEDNLLLHPETENRMIVATGGASYAKKSARNNRYGLPFEYAGGENVTVSEVVLLRKPLLEAACEAQKWIGEASILDDEVFEYLIRVGCIGGFDKERTIAHMKALQPRDVIALARSWQLGVWTIPDYERSFPFREDLYHELIQRGVPLSKAPQFARILDQAHQRQAAQHMGMMLEYLDQAFIDECLKEQYRPSVLSVTGNAYYALLLTRLRMEKPGKYEELAAVYTASFNS